jgi:hypothetical protein
LEAQGGGGQWARGLGLRGCAAKGARVRVVFSGHAAVGWRCRRAARSELNGDGGAISSCSSP